MHCSLLETTLLGKKKQLGIAGHSRKITTYKHPNNQHSCDIWLAALSPETYGALNFEVQRSQTLGLTKYH